MFLNVVPGSPFIRITWRCLWQMQIARSCPLFFRSDSLGIGPWNLHLWQAGHFEFWSTLCKEWFLVPAALGITYEVIWKCMYLGPSSRGSDSVGLRGACTSVMLKAPQVILICSRGWATPFSKYSRVLRIQDSDSPRQLTQRREM